ncbi:MAG TPA: cytochrome c [Candidatus Limnocylindria bacterium]|nr:cytochrome c [Candidatus Limnocylindria bacterium]
MAADTNGFAVKFTSADGKVSDVMVLPNLWLYVESGKSATPFVPAGKFTGVFEGGINGDLRTDYFFKAEELSGSLKLEINNAVVLETSTANTLSGKVQINKGPNAVRATFTSAGGGDSALRLGWTEKGTNVNPIPNTIITHARTPELQKAEMVYLGRELFLENRCAKCHVENFPSPVPELAMDAPGFDGIGARRNYEWLAKWILAPKATRASVHMPKLLHGTKAKEDAEAIAAFLATLKTELPVPSVSKAAPFGYNSKAFAEISQRSGVSAKAVGEENAAPADPNQERKPIFERLHCAGCHNAPGSSEIDPAKLSLGYVAQKFAPGKLAEFLKAPEKQFAWIRMPNFKLAEAEAKELAEFLLKSVESASGKAAPADKAIIERGQTLVQSTGCLNCHTAGKLENKFMAPGLAKLTKESKGCLAEKRDEKSKAPDFTFSGSEREALLAFVKTDFASISRHAPMEFAARETRLLKCTACHGQIDLVPPLEVVGGKLKPEWTAAFLGGEPFKVRADIHPKGELWVNARMPAFQSRASSLAGALAAQQGYAPRSRDEGPIDEEAAKIGHKMVGKDNGLSCISCHAVNDLPALEVFESEGLNFGLTGARLLKPYFFRWMRSPLAIDPQTKMPGYFEDGKSALTDYYEGDAEKQINALYEYIRLGEKMAAPVTGQ